MKSDKSKRAAYNPPQKLSGKTSSQQKYINSLYEFDMIVVEGDAGTGKTFPPSVIAVDMLRDQRYNIDSIQLIRPNVPLGKTMGFLKGDLYEKAAPWMVPFMDGFLHRLQKTDVRNLVNQEVIEYIPTEYLRGRTWNNCFVIIDEAQNLEYEAMKCILRRIGVGCKLVICADLDQCDLKNPAQSGMQLLYDIDDYAITNELRRPYCWHALEGSVRSDLCEWFGTAIKEVEKQNSVG